jgi:Predicted permeases
MESTVYTLLERIFQTVFPLVTIVSVGYFYARWRNTDMAIANRINIDVFCPALIFSVMSAKSFDLPTYSMLAIGGIGVILGSGLLLLPVCRLLGVNGKTFLPSMMFNNCGNLGLPLLVLAFGDQALPAAVILFLVGNVLQFTVGTYMMDHRTNPLNVLRMPMIIATMAGLIISSFQITLPTALQVPIDMLGQISIPLMLFALGVRMTSVDFTHWKIGLWGALLAPLSGIVVALLLYPILNLPAEHFAYLLVFGALPPAVLNYMIAERYDQEPHIVASVVLIGNIGSLVIIPLVLAFVL